MKYLLLFLMLGSFAFSQPDIDHLVERNIFEPQRGQKPDDDVPEEDEVAPISKDMPVFDGTVFIGDVKIALFTYMLEGKQTSARIRLNEKVGGYTLTSIERTKVELSGAGKAVPLELFSLEASQKTKRGGTKKTVKAKAPPRVKKRLPGKGGKAKPTKGKGRIKPDPKKNQNAKNKKGVNKNKKGANKNKKPSRFPKRTPSKKRNDNARKKVGNLTNKF